MRLCILRYRNARNKKDLTCPLKRESAKLGVSMRDDDKLRFRTYHPEDGAKLVSFFNKTFENYAGFVPRTLEYWSWYYKSRPDVKEDGITILEYKDQIVAYAVVGKTGNIWEFCYDFENEKAEEIASLLMEKSVAYAIDNEASEIKLHAPKSDKLIRKICLNMGFTNTHYRYLFLSVLDFVKLVDKILNGSDPIRFEGRVFEIILKDAPTWMDESLYIEFNTPSVSVKGKSTKTPDVKIETTVFTLAEIIFRKKNLWWSLLMRKIKIAPLWNLFKALEFLDKLRLNGVWFTPIGDCY